MDKRDLTPIERSFLGLPDVEAVLSEQDQADWFEFAETLNDFVFSSDKLDKDIALALIDKGE